MRIIEDIKKIEILVARKSLYGIFDDDEITQAFDKVFDYISSAPYGDLQIARTTFISLLREYSRTVARYLIKIQLRKVEALNGKAIGPPVLVSNKEYDQTAMMQMFSRCLESLEGKPVRLSTFTLSLEFSRNEEEIFYDFLIDTLQGILSSASSSVRDDSLQSTNLLLMLHYHFSKKSGKLELFYRLFCNYIQNFAYSGEFGR